ALALSALSSLFTARSHVGSVITLAHVLVGIRTDEAGIRAQMLAHARRHRRTGCNDGVQGRCQLGHIVVISCGHDDRQRDATGVDQQHSLAPIFSPGRWGWARATLPPAVPSVLA